MVAWSQVSLTGAMVFLIRAKSPPDVMIGRASKRPSPSSAVCSGRLWQPATRPASKATRFPASAVPNVIRLEAISTPSTFTCYGLPGRAGRFFLVTTRVAAALLAAMGGGAFRRAASLAACLAAACARAGGVVDGGAAGVGGAGVGGASVGGVGGAGAGAGGVRDAGASTGGAGGRADGGDAAGDAGSSPALAIVTRQGTRFMEGGRRHVFVGANFWQAMNLGAEGATGDRARLGRELDRLQALGVTNLRVMAASEGPDTEPYRMVPSLMPQPGTYNESVFRGLDFFLDQAARRGMRAVMVLNNYWEWSGGMGQYVSWGQGTRIPYRLDAGGTYERFTQYVDRFYACAPCQDAYRAHIRTVVGRVNTVNGRRYGDDGAIFAWELANEPRDYPANWIGDVA